MMKKLSISDLSKIALVAALYVILTISPGLSAISYGPIQFRISEMLNFLAFYNPMYIIAVTIGCMIANYMSFSLIDVVVGGLSTLVFLSLGVYWFKSYKNKSILGGLVRLDHFLFTILFSVSMITIAIEMHVIQGLPLLLTWATLIAGEFLSLFIGSILIRRLDKVIDFTK